MNEAFEKWAEGRYRSAIEEQDIKSEAEQAFLAGRLQGLDEAAKVCLEHTPKDFTTAGIITRAKCAEVVLALKGTP